MFDGYRQRRAEAKSEKEWKRTKRADRQGKGKKPPNLLGVPSQRKKGYGKACTGQLELPLKGKRGKRTERGSNTPVEKKWG